MRIPAGDVEALVLDRLRVFFSSRIDVSDAVAPLDLEAHPLDAALRNASKLSERWLAMLPVVMKSLVRDFVEQITVAMRASVSPHFDIRPLRSTSPD
jgi:site-specific DNA recombinase